MKILVDISFCQIGSNLNQWYVSDTERKRWMKVDCVITHAEANINLTALFYFSFMSVTRADPPPSSSSDDNNRPGSDLKQTRLWVTGGCFAAPAWPRLAGSGDSRPAATQAAPTGETTGESRLVTPPCPFLSPSIHPLIYPRAFFSPFSPWHSLPDFFFLICLFLLFSFTCHPTFSFSLISSLFTLHLQSFPNFLSSFILATFSFIERLERAPEDIRRLQLNTPVLSALVAGHTSIYDFTPNSIHLSGIAGTFGLSPTEFELLANCLDLHGCGCSVQFKIEKHILLSYSVFCSILRLNTDF